MLIIKKLFTLLSVSLLLFACGQRPHAEQSAEGHQEHQANTEDSAGFPFPTEPTSQKVISSQRVINPAKHSQTVAIKAYGFIAADVRRSKQVANRVAGRIEKLYVKYENQFVRRGQKILDLYSPDLNAFQEELVYAERTDPGGEFPKHAAHKLRLLGVTDRQIETILSSGKIFDTLSIYSPHDGYIFYNPAQSGSKGVMASPPSAGKMAGGMGAGMSGAGSSGLSSAPSAMASNAGPIREGDYVNAGQTLFWINDLKEVWGILSVQNNKQRQLEVGDSVIVVSELMPEAPFKTIIRFIEPQYAGDQKFTQARVYLHNKDGTFLLNSLLEANIYTGTSSALTLPSSSILYLGSREAVWKKTGETRQGNHIFEIQLVQIGGETEGQVTILGGLNPEDFVALDAGYLVDRESLVNPD